MTENTTISAKVGGKDGVDITVNYSFPADLEAAVEEHDWDGGFGLPPRLDRIDEVEIAVARSRPARFFSLLYSRSSSASSTSSSRAARTRAA